jgi:type IV secretory pathway TrbF-like protein
MKTTDQDTPYMLAKQDFQERITNLIKANRHWRMATFGALALGVGAIGGLISVSLQQRVVPYAIELDGNNEVRRVVRAEVMGEPSVNHVKAALRNWIIGARTVYADYTAQQSHLNQTYAMTLPNSPGYQSLVSFHKDNNPFDRAKKENVEVTVNAVIPTTDKTWQIEWTEVTRDAGGRAVYTKAWQGSFTITIIPPTSESQILVNPLGVYVKQFAWSTRL